MRVAAPAPVVFAAVHMGPYQSIAPVEALLSEPPLYAVEGLARRHRLGQAERFVDLAVIDAAGGGAAFLAETGARVLVRSTSDDVEGENIEETLMQAAAACGLRVIVVEDFPGNFHATPAGRLDALCVEGEAAAELHVSRGVAAGRVHITGNPRYDALRTVDTASRRAAVRAGLRLASDEGVALWVGQPDGDASWWTLEALLPALRAAKTTLLFRSHPRDPAYGRDRYAGLLGAAGVAHRDVTPMADLTGLCCAADLVMTQFSSVAVEASYLGTPALFVLLPTLGGAYIRTRKGYSIPPWCKENCAFLLDDAKMAAVVVDSAMHDPEAREAVRVNFAQRYASRRPSAPAVARIITACLER